MSYVDKFTHDETNVVAIDFDGVIHNNNLGYKDGSIYGDPIGGAIESIKLIHSKGIKIIIYSCKCHPCRPLYKNKNGSTLIWEWLEKYDIKKYIEDVVWGKPHAVVYIDDKGYRFKNWNSTICFLNEKFLKKGENK